MHAGIAEDELAQLLRRHTSRSKLLGATFAIPALGQDDDFSNGVKVWIFGGLEQPFFARRAFVGRVEVAKGDAIVAVDAGD